MGNSGSFLRAPQCEIMGVYIYVFVRFVYGIAPAPSITDPPRLREWFLFPDLRE